MQTRRPSRSTGDQNGTDLRKLLSTVNEASQTARNAWLAYLFILAYLAVTLAGIGHKDLLLDTPTTLPFVNVQIPLTGFFTFAPVVLLFFHFGLLLQHRMLYGKALALKTKLPDETASETAPEIRDEIHSYFFTQALVGRRNVPALQLAFRIMLFATFVFGPLTLLFYFQAKFLAYHDELMTWLHRALILIDVIVLSTFGRFVRHFKDDESRAETARFVLPAFKVPGLAGAWFGRMRSWIADAPVLVRRSLRAIAKVGKGIKDLGVYVCVCAVLFVSLFVASVPDGLVDRAMRLPGLTLAVPMDCRENHDPGSFYERNVYLEARPVSDRRSFFLTALFYEQRGERDACFKLLNMLGGSRNLIVTDVDLVKDQEVTEQNQHEMLHSLRERDLRYADFSRSDFKQFDFERANLQGARLQQSDLRRSRLKSAQLEGADLSLAQLQGANLGSAQLQGISMTSASLQGAKMWSAELQGVDLSSAQLQGADLRSAKLHGANLTYARLDYSNLDSAELEGADLSHAWLKGANLESAKLLGVDLEEAQLQGAKLVSALLHGADLREANLQGAYLYRAVLLGADLSYSDLQGANLVGAWLQGANLAGASLQGADLTRTQLQGANLGGSKLKGANLQAAQVWLAVPPGEQAADLVNYIYVNEMENAVSTLQSVLSSQVYAFEDRMKSRGHISKLVAKRMSIAFDAFKPKLEAVIKSEGASVAEKRNQRIWRQLKAKAPKPEPEPVKLACYLAELSCSDETEKAFIVQSSIDRVIGIDQPSVSSPFELPYQVVGVIPAEIHSKKDVIAPKVFHRQLQSCPAVMKRVPENKMALLEKAAANDRTVSKPETPPCGPGEQAPLEK